MIFDGSIEEFRKLRLKGNYFDGGGFVVILIFESGERRARSSIEPGRQLRKWMATTESPVKRIVAGGKFVSWERVCKEVQRLLDSVEPESDDEVVARVRSALAASPELLVDGKVQGPGAGLL